MELKSWNFFSGGVENIVGKGENAGNPHVFFSVSINFPPFSKNNFKTILVQGR